MMKKGMGFVMAGVLLLGAQAWAADTAAPKSFKGALAKYDTNKDKKLSQDELSGSGLDVTALDADKDGVVDAKEWRSGHRHERREDHKDHREHMDHHRSGAKPAPEQPESTNPM
jgi:hypothetical protein